MDDLRSAWQTISRSRGFTFAVAGLLAAGIGMTTLIFSAVDAILLRPLPVRHPEQLVHFVQRVPRVGTISRMSVLVYEAFRDHSQTMSAVFGEFANDVMMSEPGPVGRIRVHFSTPEFFDELGVKALLGRTLVAGDAKDQTGLPPALLSYGFWRRRFNRDPQALGRTLRLQGNLFQIVGVLPEDFNGFTADTSPDVRLPLRVLPLIEPGYAEYLQFVSLDLAGRLKPGVSPKQALDESRAIWKGVLDTFDKSILLNLTYDPVYPLELDSLENGTSILRDRYASALKFLIACASFLLVMVCANVAGLLLARSAVRRGEIAVRLALGATRIRLARQMLVESAVLAALGATGGVGLAAVCTPLLSRLLPPIRDLGANRLALSLGIGVDRRVLLFSLAVSIATVLLFGLAPAIAAARTSLDSVLRSVRVTGSLRGRQALILVQVALCTLLFAGAGLLIRTFERLHGLNPGFDASHIVTFTIVPSRITQPKQARAFVQDLMNRIHQVPGVAAVGFAQRGVLRDRGLGTTVAPAGERPSPSDFLATAINGVSPEYFETMGIRLLAGNLFAAGDGASEAHPEHVVVNRAFVERYFPGTDPLGKLFGTAQPGKVAAPERQIIGVVSDAKYRSLREPIPPMIFTSSPYLQSILVIHVRSSGPPETVIQPVRQALASFDSSMPILEIDKLTDEVDASASGERLTATLGSIFAALAILLSAAGIYGLLAYTVTQRRREMGIRSALGASPANIAGLTVRQTLGMVASGILVGLLLTRLASPFIAALLYGISPLDWVPLCGAVLAVLGMTAIAAAIPATRAARIDPATALREQG